MLLCTSPREVAVRDNNYIRNSYHCPGFQPQERSGWGGDKGLQVRSSLPRRPTEYVNGDLPEMWNLSYPKVPRRPGVPPLRSPADVEGELQMTVEVSTSTPLQRLSEIVEAGKSHPASSAIADTTAKQAFIFASMAVTRFLCSPEAVEVLARAIDHYAFDGVSVGHGGQQRLFALQAAKRVLDTIAEQALKEPSHG